MGVGIFVVFSGSALLKRLLMFCMVHMFSFVIRK